MSAATKYWEARMQRWKLNSEAAQGLVTQQGLDCRRCSSSGENHRPQVRVREIEMEV